MRTRIVIGMAAASMLALAAPALAQSTAPAAPPPPPEARTVTPGFPDAYNHIKNDVGSEFVLGSEAHKTPEECQHEQHMELQAHSPNVPSAQTCSNY